MKLGIIKLEKELLEIDQQLFELLPQSAELRKKIQKVNGDNELILQRYLNLEKKISELQHQFYFGSIRKFFLGA